MLRAGRPRERGHIGVGRSAVECGCECPGGRLQRGARRRTAFASSSLPPGREPISRIRAKPYLPLERSFSRSRARSTATGKQSGEFVQSAGVSDRMSSLAGAEAGIDLPYFRLRSSRNCTMSGAAVRDADPVFGKESNHPRESMYRVGHSVIAPTVASGASKAISKRRLARASQVMWSWFGPSRIRNEPIREARLDWRHKYRMPLRFPSPSSPTLAISKIGLGFGARPGISARRRATASSAANPAPLSETPGPCRQPSGPARRPLRRHAARAPCRDAR